MTRIFAVALALLVSGCASRAAAPQATRPRPDATGVHCPPRSRWEPEPVPPAALAELLEQQSGEECPEDRLEVWKRLGLEAPCAVIKRAYGDSHDVSAVHQRVARTYRLPDTAVPSFIRGAASRTSIYAGPDGAGRETRAFADFLGAARAAPGNVAALAACITAPSYAGGTLYAEPLVIEALAASPDPNKTALELLGAGDALWSWHALLAAFVLERDPGSLAPLLEGFGLANHGEEELYLAFLQTALADRRLLDEQTLVLLADRTVRSLLAAQAPSLAVETLDALPTAIRKAILLAQVPARDKHGLAVGETENGRTYRLEPAGDVRPALGLAFLLADDEATARELVAACPAGQSSELEPRGDRESFTRRLHCRVLRAASSEDGDPFDLVVKLKVSSIYRWFAPVLVKSLSAHYPGSLRDLLESAEHSAQYRAEEQLACDGLPALDEQRARLRAAARAERARLTALLQTLPAETAADSATQTPEWMARLLATEPAGILHEHPLPEGTAPYSRKDAPAEVENLPEVPRGFWPARVAKADDRLFLVALSQNFDPTGELSGGGYWLFESREGQNWGAPLYLGLRQYHPYVIAPSSRLPFAAGETLRMEAKVHEIDESSITFPPLGLKPKREVDGLFLEIALADLRRDTDGDGLTDLMEARLLTNPQAADSDGDGLDDASDPLPLVVPGPATERGRILSAFFESLGLAQRPALIVGLPEEGDCPLRLPKGKEPADETRALYAVADRGDFGAIETMVRLIVLSPGEYEQARQRFGEFYPLRITRMEMDPKGERVFIQWSESWRGGAMVGRKHDGRWTMEIVSSWIT